MKERIMVSRTFQPRRFEPVRVEIEVVREFVSENDVKTTAVDLNQQIKLVVDTIIEDDEKHGRPSRLPEPEREDFNADRPPRFDFSKARGPT